MIMPFPSQKGGQHKGWEEVEQDRLTENLGMFWMTTDLIIKADGIIWGSH